LKAVAARTATQIPRYPVRVSDIDIFDHMNKSVYGASSGLPHNNPELLQKPLRGPSNTTFPRVG